ncbi:hypothetical protein DPEC_G00294440 [Dallia pectoralis]|uniref:Uncharacterized protein n=1 Tax=Dallia pectoralis TaxID=75939 RepID=A0ACC2FIM3_DALPE|nr:hypothetical protein DPEC_G00294440 [Dallia pectoralis]
MQQTLTTRDSFHKVLLQTLSLKPNKARINSAVIQLRVMGLRWQEILLWREAWGTWPGSSSHLSTGRRCKP